MDIRIFPLLNFSISLWFDFNGTYICCSLYIVLSLFLCAFRCLYVLFVLCRVLGLREEEQGRCHPLSDYSVRSEQLGAR